MARVALVVRGHERGAFRTREFAEYVRGMPGRLGAEVAVFVHTWAESEAKASHRPLRREGVRRVTEREVREYFGGGVEWVAVDDDARIVLPGSAEGMIGGIPARPWKNMWYGKHRAVRAVLESGAEFDLVVSVRVDNFLNMESRRHARINARTMDETVRRALASGDEEAVHFVTDRPCPGVDNFYAARPAAMSRLVERFHLDMDSVREKHRGVHHQEFMVVFEARDLARRDSAPGRDRGP